LGECWNIHSQDYSFPGTFVPMMELSFSGPLVPWNICSLDRSFPGSFVPGNFHSQERINPADPSLHEPFIPWTVRSLELSFQTPGPFLLWSIHSFVSRAAPGPLTKNEQHNKQNLDLSCHGPFIHLSAETRQVHLQRRNSITNRSVGLRQRPCTAAIHKQ